MAFTPGGMHQAGNPGSRTKGKPPGWKIWKKSKERQERQRRQEKSKEKGSLKE